MRRRIKIAFRAGGKTVSFLARRARGYAANQRAKAAHVRYTPYVPPGKKRSTAAKGYVSQRELKAMTKALTGGRKQVYRCLSCGKRYVNYSAALRHRNKHKEVGSGLILE